MLPYTKHSIGSLNVLLSQTSSSLKFCSFHQFQGQKKTVAEEETASRETGLRIRLLTAYK